MASKFRVGMSGWTYAPWRGDFYPEKLTQKKELEYASRQVTSIEINGTFYSMQKPSSFKTWATETPDDFQFSVKAPRYLTHIKRLKEYGAGLANFFATGLLKLEHKLGVILWQLPSFLPLKDGRFEDFFGVLPRTGLQAMELAKHHSPSISDICDFEIQKDFPIEHVFEFRNPTFFNPDFLKVMKQNNIGLVLADSADKSIYSEDLTSSVVYLRMHGLGKKHAKGYTSSELLDLSERIRSWTHGKRVDGPKLLTEEDLKPRDVYVYFDNDAKETAPANAIQLLKMLSGKDAEVEQTQSKRRAVG